MKAPRIVAFVMAGGEGSRLRPLTDEIPKPALPFADRCRLIDFVLSNLHNSGIRSTFVLLQYKPRAIVEHLARNWAAASLEPARRPPNRSCSRRRMQQRRLDADGERPRPFVRAADLTQGPVLRGA